MKYYLVKTSQYFCAEGGEVDSGSTSYSVTKGEPEDFEGYPEGGIKEGIEYWCDYNGNYTDSLEAEWEGATDGYNATEETVEYKEITEKEYEEFEAIIDAYYEMNF